MAENGILDYQGMNQAIYRGATSNIVVDTQSMSIEIGTGNTSHTSNLHFECNHDANVASIKLNSNVTTEFSRSKKIIKYPRVAMTSGQSGLGAGYTQNDYNIQVSTEWDSPSLTYAATYAVDNTFNNLGWLSGRDTYNSDGTAENASSPDIFQNIKGSWINIQLPDKIVLDHFTIIHREASTLRNADSGILWAKNKTDSTWIRIHDFSDLNPASFVTNTIHTNQVVAYDEYRLQITKMEPYTVGTPGLSIGEWQLFGVPEYDPEAHGTDVVVKSVPNVPNTDWLEVYYDAKGLENGSTTVNDLKPVGTANNGTVGGNTSVTDEAFTFDGTGDYITSTVTTGTGNQSFSVACWFKFTTLGGLLWGFTGTTNGTSGSNPTNNSTPHAYFNTTGSINFDFWANSTVTAEKLIEANRWYAGVWTYDGTTRKIYIDGTQVHLPQSSTPLSIIDNTSRLSIGIYPTNLSGGPMTGSVANFRLFNRALTTDEIYQLYAYQKEYFGHGDLGMTLKAGRLGIGTSEPRAALDVKGGAFFNGLLSTGLPAIFGRVNNANYVQQSTVDQNINDVLYTQGQNMKRTGGGLVFPVAGMYIIQLRTHCWYSGGAYAVRDEHQYNRYNSAGTIYSKQNRGTIYDIAMGGSGGNSDMHHASIVFIHANEGDYVILSHTTSPTTTRNYNNEWNYISAACVCLDDPQFSS